MTRSTLLTGMIFLLSPLLLLGQPTGPSQRITWSADVQNVTVKSNGDEVIELSGNVQLKQGNVTITASQGTYYSAGDRAELRGNVRIVQPGTTLTAPAVDYNGGTGFALAPSGVTILDEDATLTAGYGEYYVNRRISNFRNGVTLRDSNAVLTASRGTYNSLDRVATFEEKVEVISDSGRINADRLTYWRATEQSYAVGNIRLLSLKDSSLLTCDTLRHKPKVETFATGHVVLTSEKESAVLTGDSLQHLPAKDYTVVTGSPRLIQADSTVRPLLPSSEGIVDTLPPDSSDITRAPTNLDTIQRGDSLFTIQRDTTEITALKLERFTGDRKEFVATGNARMKRGDLEARSGIARFFDEEEVIALGPGDGRNDAIDTSAADGSDQIDADTVTTDGGDVRDSTEREEDEEFPEFPEGGDGIAGETPPDSVTIPLTPIFWYDDSQLTGDTITVYLEEKKLQLIDVVGSAFAISTSDAPERYDQLAAQHLIFNIYDDTIRTVHAQESAASIYFLFDKEAPDGVNRASCDTIIIWFESGKASRIGYYGPRTGSEGEIIPEKDVVGKERTYRLSGFTLYERDEAKEKLDDSATSREEGSDEEMGTSDESTSLPDNVDSPTTIKTDEKLSEDGEGKSSE
ncbi:MAG: OstA-like protein [Candidatus Kapaibacterium sp.]